MGVCNVLQVQIPWSCIILIINYSIFPAAKSVSLASSINHCKSASFKNNKTARGWLLTFYAAFGVFGIKKNRTPFDEG